VPTPDTPTSLPIDFGHRYLLDRLDTRLRESLKPDGTTPLEPALVAGVFGEWGSGKSHLLQGVAQRVRGWERQEGVLNVVVEFNAWRYEREEHLLIPLLKVAQQALEKALEADLKDHPEVVRRELVLDRAYLLADLCSGLYAKGGRELLNMGLVATGLPWQLPAPATDSKKAGDAAKNEPFWKRWSRLGKARQDERRIRLPMQALESLYFDFLEHLKAVTGRNPAYLKKHRERLAQGWVFKGEPSELRVNLIFLVDDLDRCLPDKAVEVLEAIKLFLEVPGCAFVLALDEEVVERGIAHRYRDYALQGRAHLTPITGAEYLEKLVHLPIRLPRPSRLESRKHLAARLPDWFRGPDGRSNELAEWVANLTPPVPRKLHRMAELLQLADGMLGSEAHRLGVDTAKRHQWLALVCALQLFAPALFRYLRVHGADLLQALVEWRTTGDLRDLDALKTQLTEARRAAAPEVLAYQMKLERLPDLVRDALHNRSGFDLLEVLGRAGRLQQEAKLEQVALGAMLSFVWLADEEEPVLPPADEGAPAMAVSLAEDDPDQDEVPTKAQSTSVHVFASLDPTASSSVVHVQGRYHRRYDNDYTLPRYARLENAFALDEAVRSGDLRVLQNALAVEGGNLLGRLIPDEVVARWCDEPGLRWLTPSQPPTHEVRQLLQALGPHLSQWAVLRLTLKYGLNLLGELGRLTWMQGTWKQVSQGSAELIAQVPGVAGRDARHELSLSLPLHPPVLDSTITRWRVPMGLETSTLKLGGEESKAPYILGGDEFGLFSEFTFNGVAQRLRYIAPGRFMMGSPDFEPGRSPDEGFQHQVSLKDGYWLADTLCTQALWLAVVGAKNPSQFQGGQLPVEQVSWHEVTQEFMPKLQALLPPECVATLPTEGEWEYACRAGTQTAYSWGDKPDHRLANLEKSVNKTTPVRTYPANAWGLFDTHGNVCEWCLDRLRGYTERDVVDPIGRDDRSRQVLRGGSWSGLDRHARSASRFSDGATSLTNFISFRFAVRFR